MTKNISMPYKETDGKDIREKEIVNNRDNTQIVIEDNKKKNIHLKIRVKYTLLKKDIVHQPNKLQKNRRIYKTINPDHNLKLKRF